MALLKPGMYTPDYLAYPLFAGSAPKGNTVTEAEALALANLALCSDVYADDTEAAHRFADDILCDLLTSLGYVDVVAEYRKIHKFYV